MTKIIEDTNGYYLIMKELVQDYNFIILCECPQKYQTQKGKRKFGRVYFSRTQFFLKFEGKSETNRFYYYPKFSMDLVFFIDIESMKKEYTWKRYELNKVFKDQDSYDLRQIIFHLKDLKKVESKLPKKTFIETILGI